MKTIRQISLLALAAVLLAAPSALADAQISIDVGGCVRPDLEVFVWPDRGVDGVYHPGDQIRVFFEVTQDCYVVLYDIDTRGRLHILFPFDPWQDNYVHAGRVYELPNDWDNFALTVEGPTGTEYIQAVASPYPFDLPDWPIYTNSPGMYPSTCPDRTLNDFRAGRDPMAYIDKVNRRLARHRWEYCATDLARFYVHRPLMRPYRTRFYPDPWYDVYYGDIYIGWPIGARIYINDIFIGIAPCHVPRLPFGFHWIRCYDGHRLVREHRIRYRHKREYRHDAPRNDFVGRFHDEVFRSVPGEKVKKAVRTRPTSPAAWKGYQKGEPSPPAAPKIRRTYPGGDVAKKKVRSSVPTERKTERRVINDGTKSGRSKKRSGLAKIVTGVGRVVAGELKKSAGKRRDTARVSAQKSTDGKKSESSKPQKSGKTRRTEKKRSR